MDASRGLNHAYLHEHRIQLLVRLRLILQHRPLSLCLALRRDLCPSEAGACTCRLGASVRASSAEWGAKLATVAFSMSSSPLSLSSLRAQRCLSWLAYQAPRRSGSPDNAGCARAAASTGCTHRAGRAVQPPGEAGGTHLRIWAALASLTPWEKRCAKPRES